MAEELKEKFSRIYKEQFVPYLRPLEDERIAANKKVQPLFKIWFIAGIVILVTIFNRTSNPLLGYEYLRKLNDYIFVVCFFVLFICGWIASCYINKWNREIKRHITSKLLPLFGNYHFSQNKNLITLDEIKTSGLFYNATEKIDDDMIIGHYNGCNLVINECRLRNNDTKYFDGMIVKVTMKKSFNGLTVLGDFYALEPVSGVETVELESIDFMKNRKIYTTDQIEARYILTASFMEKLDKISKIFNTKVLKDVCNDVNLKTVLKNNHFRVSAIFYKGYAYIFIPTVNDLFELNLDKSLYDENSYSVIFEQLTAIQDMIDYLNIDKNTGL